MVDDEFGEADCGKDKVKILLAFSISKNQTKVGYLTFGAKKAFNFLWHAFTQMPIFQHFNPKRHI